MTSSIKPMLTILGVTFAFAVEPAPIAQAQVTLDVSKLTCGKLLSYKFATAEKIEAIPVLLGRLPTSGRVELSDRHRVISEFSNGSRHSATAQL